MDVLEPALSLNTGKTQFIWLGTKHSLAKRDTDRLSSLLPSLTGLTSVRNLGFIIDQELNMKDHITKLCQLCYYQLRQIRTVRHSLTSSAIQTLVHAFICTRVDFSNILLYGTSASWFLDIGRNDPVEEVSPSPHHSCGIYFLPTSDFSTMNINFSGRDLKLIICNSPCYATEDLCHQCELYYYYY